MTERPEDQPGSADERPNGLLVAVTLDANRAKLAPMEIGRMAGELDEAGVDMLVLAGAASGLDPLIFAGWLTTKTRRAGLVTVLPALHSIPFHVARALSAVDFLSRGRTGWAPTTRDHLAQAEAIGPAARIDSDKATAKAVDFIDATCALWDSWDADALIIDKARGIYLDADQVRRVDYRGPYFQVMGPLNSPRPPQGYPVLVQFDGDPLCDAMTGRADAIIAEDADSAALIALRARDADAGGNARIFASVDLTDGETTLADSLQTLFRAGTIDGVHLTVPSAAALEAIVKDLLPRLSRLGLLGAAAGEGSLRSRLGLPDHANADPGRRFTFAAAA